MSVHLSSERLNPHWLGYRDSLQDSKFWGERWVSKFWGKGLLLKFLWETLFKRPASFSLTILWNGGSLLGSVLFFQVFTGIFLSFHFGLGNNLFYNVNIYITHDVPLGWLFRVLHLNGARFFFIVLYFHIFRGLYFWSFRLTLVWWRGVFLLILIILRAFLGYTLPWGNIRLWGATVITNIIRAIPFVGGTIVSWLWRDYRVSQRTIHFFFSLHFIIPLFSFVIVIFHIFFLHLYGSTSSRGIIFEGLRKISFYPYFWAKDRLNLIFWVGFFVFSLSYPWFLGDTTNFILANPLKRPFHIKPEWYFLFAYSILRAIPSKFRGVAAIALRIVILLLLSYFSDYLSFWEGMSFLFHFFGIRFVILTWLGVQVVEEPYILLSQIFTFFYFFSLFFPPLITKTLKMFF